MKLSKIQFEKLLQKKQLVFSLTGMSNIGKTYWSKKFRDFGFKHMSCDDLIEKKLGPCLKTLGYSGIEDVSRWMGQPYDERFDVNQQKYLSFEKEVIENIFAEINNNGAQNTIIDTTGSVVHTGKEICTKLKDHSLVIYIEATENMMEEMFQRYIKEPKPVVFDNIFEPQEHETAMETLKRCYRKLLKIRSALYAEYADVIIPRQAIKENMDVHQFIALVKESL